MTRLNEVETGKVLTLEKNPTRPQLFRYSAVTWNAHRIHYDPEYTREEEGHPDVLVQQHFYGAIVQELLLDWLDGEGKLTELNWRNVGRATPEDTLDTTAEVTKINRDERTVRFDISVETTETTCVEGSAAVQLFE